MGGACRTHVEMRMRTYEFRRVKERIHMENVDVDGRIVLK
jgi:hypothetical protein